MKFLAPYDKRQCRILAEIKSPDKDLFIIGAVDPNVDGNCVRGYFIGGSMENNLRWLAWLKVNTKFWMVSEEFPFVIEDIEISEFCGGEK